MFFEIQIYKYKDIYIYLNMDSYPYKMKIAI